MLAWLIVNEFLESKKFNEIHKYIYEAAKRQGIDLEQKTNAQLLIDLPFKEKPVLLRILSCFGIRM